MHFLRDFDTGIQFFLRTAQNSCMYVSSTNLTEKVLIIINRSNIFCYVILMYEFYYSTKLMYVDY